MYLIRIFRDSVLLFPKKLCQSRKTEISLYGMKNILVKSVLNKFVSVNENAYVSDVLHIGVDCIRNQNFSIRLHRLNPYLKGKS